MSKKKKPPQSKVTPPHLAAEYGVSPTRILQEIRTGRLRAINIAGPKARLPRYLIDREDIAEFERLITVIPCPPPRPRRDGTVNSLKQYI